MAAYVYGHTTPDLDSIVGAISLSYLKNKIGEECIPTRQGKLNPESEFVLEKFGVKAPELKTEYAGCDVYLVDHSDLAQSPKDIKEANILGIVDHHKLGDITTPAPLECWIRPVGCSNTVIKQMFDWHGVEIPKDIAGIMLAAILSDTIIFKSPTCTKEDTKAARELSKIAEVEDLKALGMEMFNVKSAVTGASANELITRDYKDFQMGDFKLGVGQLEVVDLNVFNEIKGDLHTELKKVREEGGRDALILLLTDIMEEGSQVLVCDDDISKYEQAFNVKFDENNEAWYPGCMSRKKQVIPPLEKILA